MKNKAYNLISYAFSSGERVLVDANVWLYLFPPPTNPNSQPQFSKTYSAGFFALVKAKAISVLDPVVLSEYINRYCRIEWEGNYKGRYPKYKDFRNSLDFQNVSHSASAYARKILSFCNVHPTPAHELEITKAIDEFEKGTLDFNDALLVDICKKHGFKLLTNDSDFQAGGIEVLTTNPKLLRACP